MVRSVLSVAAGGAIGAIGRYLLLAWLGGVDDGFMPWGTVVANIFGALCLGFVVRLVERGAFTEGTRLFLAVGLLGGFTTFSFFSIENLDLLRDDRYLALMINAGGQLVIGTMAAIVGYWLAGRQEIFQREDRG
jgi:fluoride exporter